MRVEPLPLSGAHLITLEPHQDRRGRLTRLYCGEALASLGMDAIAQVNHSLTRLAGTVRGMHFQFAPRAENKLITCLRGRVFDVIVDLRAGSPTFLEWHGVELRGERGETLHAPRGFAHGFQALEADSELLYLHDALYAPEHEGAISVLDPHVAIAWPIPITDMSDRDRSHSFVNEQFKGLCL
jgi:dTDP-4-dehydrorhamnose 3,5-epimerase